MVTLLTYFWNPTILNTTILDYQRLQAPKQTQSVNYKSNFLKLALVNNNSIPLNINFTMEQKFNQSKPT